MACLGEVADEHPRYPDRHPEARSHLDEGDGAAGEVEDGAVLGLEVVGGTVLGGRGDDRLDREVVVARPGAAAGDGVHGHDAPVMARIIGHRATPVRGPGVSACPARVTSIVIS